MPKAKQAQYTKPTSQRDLEERRAPGYVPPGVVTHGVDQELSSDGFIGTDPIYKGRANYTDMPIHSEGGAEAKAFDEHYTDEVGFAAAPVEDEVPEDVVDDDSDESPSSDPATVKDEKKSGGTTTAASGGAATPSIGGSTPPPSQS